MNSENQTTGHEAEAVERLDLAELKRIAEAATQGEWEADGDTLVSHLTRRTRRKRKPICDLRYFHTPDNEANAAHIVAFQPKTALALLTALREAKEKVVELMKRAGWEGGEHDRLKSEELRQRLRAQSAEAEALRLREGLGRIVEYFEDDDQHDEAAFEPECPDCAALAAARALLGNRPPLSSIPGEQRNMDQDNSQTGASEG